MSSSAYTRVAADYDEDEDEDENVSDNENVGLLVAVGDDVAESAPQGMCVAGREIYNNLRAYLVGCDAKYNGKRLREIVRQVYTSENRLTRERDLRMNTARITLVVFNLLAFLFAFVAFVVGASSANARPEYLTFAMFSLCCLVIDVVIASVNTRGDRAWLTNEQKQCLEVSVQQTYQVRQFVWKMLEHFSQDNCAACAKEPITLAIYETLMAKPSQEFEDM